MQLTGARLRALCRGARPLACGRHHSGPAWRAHGSCAAAWDAGRLSQIVSASEVPLPLSKRPADHSETLSELLAWRKEVLAAIEAVGDAWEAADGGPGAALLQVRATSAAQLLARCRLPAPLAQAVRSLAVLLLIFIPSTTTPTGSVSWAGHWRMQSAATARRRAAPGAPRPGSSSKQRPRSRSAAQRAAAAAREAQGVALRRSRAGRCSCARRSQSCGSCGACGLR